jgi:hypothetical protein
MNGLAALPTSSLADRNHTLKLYIHQLGTIMLTRNQVDTVNS